LPPQLARFRTDDSKEILRVPAAAMEVGDLVVYNEGDELTICVGTIFHSHYGEYLDAGDSASEKLQFVMCQAVEWIVDILADRIRFRVEFEGGRVIGGSSCTSHMERAPAGCRTLTRPANTPGAGSSRTSASRANIFSRGMLSLASAYIGALRRRRCILNKENANPWFSKAALVAADGRSVSTVNSPGNRNLCADFCISTS
jgi:hypothetical protein